MVARSPLRLLRGAKQDRSEQWCWFTGEALFLGLASVFGLALVYVAFTKSYARNYAAAPSVQAQSAEQPVNRHSIREHAIGEIFGTIYQSELSSLFKMLSDQPRIADLIATLQDMEAARMRTVVFSVTWEVAEPEPGLVRFGYLNSLMDAACTNTSLKVNLAIDLVTPPPWIWKRYPDAVSFDADGRKYTRLSWFHALGNEAARTLLAKVTSHLVDAYGSCAVAVQPVYNNAYQTKYTQEYDAFQDYSPYALLEYRRWLKSKGMPLPLLNVRWRTGFRRWPDVVPPKLHSGDSVGVDFSARYWDWLRFREEFGSRVYISACEAVTGAGLQCYHRFSEMFSVVDAIYSTTMFKRVAASPHTSFLVMDSNFVTPYGVRTRPNKLRMHVAAARSYGKPVLFEGAVERLAGAGDEYDVLTESYRAALTAGASGVGLSHWLTRLPANDSLARVFDDSTPNCAGGELVGVFVPLDSCSAFHGLQWGWARTDPLHDFVEELGDRLSEHCETDLAVYVELGRFLADFHTFSRVVFVEPLLLYDTAEYVSYLAARAALAHVPHEVLRLPANVTADGPQLVVLQDLTALPASPVTMTAAAAAVAAAATLVADDS